MTLYKQLRASGNPQAANQTIISLLDKHPPQEVAEIMGVSVRWIYTIRRRYLDSGGDISACSLKRGPKSPMPNQTPRHLEDLVVSNSSQVISPKGMLGLDMIQLQGKPGGLFVAKYLGLTQVS